MLRLFVTPVVGSLQLTIPPTGLPSPNTKGDGDGSGDGLGDGFGDGLGDAVGESVGDGLTSFPLFNGGGTLAGSFTGVPPGLGHSQLSVGGVQQGIHQI